MTARGATAVPALRRLALAACLGAGLGICGAVAAAGPRSLWGTSGDLDARFQQTCAAAQVLLAAPWDPAAGPEHLADVRDRLGALLVDYKIESAQGYALLGRLDAELAQDEPAQAALSRAAELGADGVHLLMGQALLWTHRGELEAAHEHYLRLYERGPVRPLLLRRLGDVQMALGRLDEAVRSYESACLGDGRGRQAGPPFPQPPTGSAGLRTGLKNPFMPAGQDGALLGKLWPPGPPAGDMPRGCLALAVAYDRAGLPARADLELRRVALMDPSGRALLGGDFVPAAERDYYRALWLRRRGDACGARGAMQAYLSAARGLAPGRSYLSSARAHLEALGAQCKEGYSSTDSAKRSVAPFIDDPLGSQRD